MAAQRPSGPAAQRPSGPAAQRPSGPAAQRPSGPAAQRPSGPAAQRPSGPAAQRPSGPAAQRPSGPAAQRPSGPAAQRPSGPAAQRPSGMTCARREADAHNSAPSAPAASSRPDPRRGCRRARLVLLLPALALLLGALGLFAAAPDALADHTFSAPSNFQTSVGDRSITVSWDPVPNAGQYLLQRKKKGEASIRSTQTSGTTRTYGPSTQWQVGGGSETTRNGATLSVPDPCAFERRPLI